MHKKGIRNANLGRNDISTVNTTKGVKKTNKMITRLDSWIIKVLGLRLSSCILGARLVGEAEFYVFSDIIQIYLNLNALNT